MVNPLAPKLPGELDVHINENPGKYLVGNISLFLHLSAADKPEMRFCLHSSHKDVQICAPPFTSQKR
jgi:hypothetical protein